MQLWSGSLMGILALLPDVLNDPSVKGAVDTLHLDPRIGLALAILGVVTLAARSHRDA